MADPIQGLIAATYTPLNSDGSINLDVIEGYVDQLLESGVTGLFVCGTTGEGMSLTTDERKALSAEFVKVSMGRCPVIVHVGHNSLFEAANLAAHAQSIGANATSATCPSYFKVDTAPALADCMQQVAASAAGIPFYYYHIPPLTGSTVDMRAFLDAAGDKIANLAGIKFSSPLLHQFRDLQQYNPERYQVFWGVDEMLLGALTFGATGAVGSTYNVIAPVYVKLKECLDAGDLDGARQWQDRAVQFVRTVAQVPFHPAMKEILGMQGNLFGPCRLPLPELTLEELERLHGGLNEIGFFEWS